MRVWRFGVSRDRFNPLPARGPGDTSLQRKYQDIFSCFNPLPARGPGDTLRFTMMTRRLTRFNPLPARGPGDTSTISSPALIGTGFNPLPARGPGDTPDHLTRSGCESVSIRSRPGGREILTLSPFSKPQAKLFQSAPGPGAGRYCVAKFQACLSSIVSIRSRPGGREILARVRTDIDGIAVSIRSRPGGREIHITCEGAFPVTALFQSAPGPGAGRYSWVGLARCDRWGVSIRSRPGGREIHTTQQAGSG